MFKIFKSTLQILVSIVLAVQLTGCVFIDRDRRGHFVRPEHHGHPSIDVQVHG